MNDFEILDIARRAMMVVLEMSMPALLTALIVGFFIGLIQALTSIQETTLTFVPKIAAMVAVLWVATDTMAVTLTDFFKLEILSTIVKI
ncbi:MAG: flagellar biosynthetic protein FliQ [Alphaproteobacteria bacterium]|jgi:flagellar biosynthetic protein FliQ